MRIRGLNLKFDLDWGEERRWKRREKESSQRRKGSERKTRENRMRWGKEKIVSFGSISVSLSSHHLQQRVTESLFNIIVVIRSEWMGEVNRIGCWWRWSSASGDSGTLLIIIRTKQKKRLPLDILSDQKKKKRVRRLKLFCLTSRLFEYKSLDEKMGGDEGKRVGILFSPFSRSSWSHLTTNKCNPMRRLKLIIMKMMMNRQPVHPSIHDSSQV